jgi:regulator of RNase E activity RraA
VTDTPLNETELAALRAIDTPTICNALEIVAPERRTTGFTTRTLHCAFPDLPPTVGYARTATIRAMQEPEGGAAKMKADRLAYYRYVEGAGPQPSVMIIQDIDSRPGAGCWWGEVHSNLHQALGCLGVVTDGGVRDLDMIAPGFQFISGTVVPSHAWVHLVDFGNPVDIYGMHTHSGDLIHADKHGAVIIPHAVAREVPAAAELCARREKPILDICKNPDFSIEMLERALAEASEIH